MTSQIEQAVASIRRSMCVGIEISNNSKFILKSPEVYVYGGVLRSPPQPRIDPGNSGICIFTKYLYSLCGVEGMLSYDVNGKRLCLMFSNPLWVYLYKRKFNLMFYGIEDSINEQLFNKMGLENEAGNICIVGDSSLSKITARGGDVEVTATMSSSMKSIIKIDIRDV